MDKQPVTVSAFETKVSSQLDELKAKLGEIEAHAKGKVADDELHAIAELHKQHAELEKKRDELKSAAAANHEAVKTSITTHLDSLKTKVDALHGKFKHLIHAK